MTNQAHAQKSRTQTRLAPEEDPEFQIAPMIDILLVLLVFFMSISSTEVLQRSDELRLPAADNAGHPQRVEGQVIVNVLWVAANNAGTIKMDEVAYEKAEQLVPGLRAAVEANPRTRLLIRADKNVPYGYLRQVMVAAGQAGVGNVTASASAPASAPPSTSASTGPAPSFAIPDSIFSDTRTIHSIASASKVVFGRIWSYFLCVQKVEFCAFAGTKLQSIGV